MRLPLFPPSEICGLISSFPVLISHLLFSLLSSPSTLQVPFAENDFRNNAIINTNQLLIPVSDTRSADSQQTQSVREDFGPESLQALLEYSRKPRL